MVRQWDVKGRGCEGWLAMGVWSVLMMDGMCGMMGVWHGYCGGDGNVWSIGKVCGRSKLGWEGGRTQLENTCRESVTKR